MLAALAVSMALPPPRATSSCTCRVRAAAMQSVHHLYGGVGLHIVVHGVLHTGIGQYLTDPGSGTGIIEKRSVTSKARQMPIF